MSNMKLKKELNRSGWIRKEGKWGKKGDAALQGLTLAEAKAASKI